MRRSLTTAIALILLSSTAVLAGPTCTPLPLEPGTLLCTITKAADCHAIQDYPYARDLLCPAAFLAAQAMVSQVADTLGVKEPTRGFFHYYQTRADPQALPEDQAQTTVACMDTPAPYSSGKSVVVGAGIPLCDLAAFVTSPGPPGIKKGDKHNPIPDQLRDYPDYFGKLYSPEPGFPLTEFRTGSVFDPIVNALGASAHDGFIADYPAFSPTNLYDPDRWQRDTRYHGISGGGGGGWGGEIAILGTHVPVTLLAFGGGGGGGMTSFRASAATMPATTLGGGGGGGMQFANGYRVNGVSYNGLGLGAGSASNETDVQYSYSDYAGSPSPQPPVHEYNPAVIAEYKNQLKNLSTQLKEGHEQRKTVVLRGGGGMGAGTEYLMASGEQFLPHALSTQAGFQFSYEFQRGRSSSDTAAGQVLGNLNDEQQNIYAFIGEAYRKASQQAFEECGRDYSNYTCICPKTHAIVICLVSEHVGDPELIPAWLQQRHCADDATSLGQTGNGFSSYQKFLLDAAGTLPASCSDVLRDYFTNLNSPINDLD